MQVGFDIACGAKEIPSIDSKKFSIIGVRAKAWLSLVHEITDENEAHGTIATTGVIDGCGFARMGAWHVEHEVHRLVCIRETLTKDEEIAELSLAKIAREEMKVVADEGLRIGKLLIAPGSPPQFRIGEMRSSQA